MTVFFFVFCLTELDTSYFNTRHLNTVTNKLFNIVDNKDEFSVKKINMKNFSCQNTWNNINQKIISVINENRISKN